ncbi:MAG TPA: ribosome maturation factor RimP [Gemmatimonadales bacterium]
MSAAQTDLTAEIRARVDALGFELVDVRLAGATLRPRLQIRVDRLDAQPGRGITIEECAVVSRALESWLDVGGQLGQRYVLEVSSPGLERPVRWPEHWERFTGRAVNVTLPVRGRTLATIVRVDRAAETVTLRTQDREEIVVALADAGKATLAVDWAALGLHFK